MLNFSYSIFILTKCSENRYCQTAAENPNDTILVRHTKLELCMLNIKRVDA